MAGRETTELRALSDEELREELEEAHQSLFTLRFQGATRQLSDNSQIAKTRKRIARIRTLLHERALVTAESEHE